MKAELYRKEKCERNLNKMILWIVLAVCIISTIIAVIAYNTYKYDLDTVYGIFTFVAVVTGIIALIMGCVIFFNRIDEGARLEAKQVQREMLVYQYENNFYENDNDVGKYQLLKDIEKWNTEVAKNKIEQNSIWKGIFIPHIYDELELIEISTGDK